MRSVIFDLDGTLADTSGDLIAAANACFADLDLGPLLDPALDQGIALRGGRAMLNEGFRRSGSHGEEEIARQYPRLLDYYADGIAVHSALYPGSLDAIAELQRVGYRTGICTNKPERHTLLLLDALGIRGAFSSIVGADTLPVRKPDPSPFHAAVERAGGALGRACLVGDSDTDRETARRAGAPSILVTFGPSGENMAALEPEALLHDYAALGEVVARLEL